MKGTRLRRHSIRQMRLAARAERVFREVHLPIGLNVGSKSAYRARHPQHVFVPNARLVDEQGELRWMGDLDLAVHRRRVERAARLLRCRLYVLPERMPGTADKNPTKSSIESEALWHTGGPVRVDAALIRRSGLRPRELALILGRPVRQLTRAQSSEVALHVARRIRGLARFFGPLTRHYGFRTWGAWMKTPIQRLDGRSPLEILSSGGSIVPSELFREIYETPALLARYWDAVVHGIGLTSLASSSASVLWEHCEDASARVRPMPDAMALFGTAHDRRPRDAGEKSKARDAMAGAANKRRR